MPGELLKGPLLPGWERTTLGDIVRRGGGHVQTGPFGSQLHASDYVSSGVPSIMPVNIGDNRIVEDGIARISEADAERLSRHRVRVGDIIYSRRGDVERRALVQTEQEGWLCGTGCLKVRLGESGVDPKFASYYLGHPEVRAWIVRHAVGATMPNLNTSIMEAVPFLVPPIVEQQAIACILGVLDEKIESNRRMNKILEVIARSIFRSWFVDFDPVRAKAAGDQPPDLPRHIARLFPNAFERSKLGEMPEGWPAKTLADLAELNPESWSKNTAPAHIEYVDLANTKWGRIESTATYLWTNAPSRAQRVLRPADTIVGTVRPGNGSYALISDEGLTGSTGFAVLRPRKPEFEQFVYLAATARDNIERLAHLADGAAYPAVHPEVVSATRVAQPSDAVIQQFSRTAGPLMSKIALSTQQSRTLSAIRDVLLPKLISGEMRLVNAERIVGRCA